jgi:hypothetical protein
LNCVVTAPLSRNGANDETDVGKDVIGEKERRNLVVGSRKNKNEFLVCIKGQFLSSPVLMHSSGRPLLHEFINVDQSSQTTKDAAS